MAAPNKSVATDKECYFYNEEYENRCSACCRAECIGISNHKCALFIKKDNERQIRLDREYQEAKKMMFYPNGVRR